MNLRRFDLHADATAMHVHHARNEILAWKSIFFLLEESMCRLELNDASHIMYSFCTCTVLSATVSVPHDFHVSPQLYISRMMFTHVALETCNFPTHALTSVFVNIVSCRKRCIRDIIWAFLYRESMCLLIPQRMIHWNFNMNQFWRTFWFNADHHERFLDIFNKTFSIPNHWWGLSCVEQGIPLRNAETQHAKSPLMIIWFVLEVSFSRGANL